MKTLCEVKGAGHKGRALYDPYTRSTPDGEIHRAAKSSRSVLVRVVGGGGGVMGDGCAGLGLLFGAVKMF